MQTSIYLAQLIGPVLLAASVSMLINGDRVRAMAREFMASTPMIYLSGVLVMVAGLAIVLSHNIWAFDWRVIITIFGWLAIVGGVFRILFFSAVEKIGESMLEKQSAMTIGGVVWLVIALVLCFFGYFG